MRLAPLLLLTLALPGTLSAQVGSETPSRDRISATASLFFKAGKIADENRLHVGGWAGLVFGDRLAVGGGGFTVVNDVELPGSAGGTGFDLDVGYGGLFLRYWEPLTPSLLGEAGLILGAGHAEVQDQLTRSEVGSDNFLMAEAEMSLLYSLLPGVAMGASVGYRMTSGVEDIPGVSVGELNTFTGTLFLRLGGE